jgi:lysophospholipase L1-like esterase
MTCTKLAAVAAWSILLAGTAVAGARVDPASAQKLAGSPLAWYDARALLLEGIGYADADTSFSRLPARARDRVTTAVWELSHNCAGIVVRFVTDSPTLSAMWDGHRDGFMNHMAPTGSAGLDLYMREGGKWVYKATGRPTDKFTSGVVSRSLPEKPTEYMLYLPLYHRVTDLRLGIATTATLAAAPPRPAGKDKPLVFYGTSITQGGCASRAGMAHPEILGRWLDLPVINLGFSGSGKGEQEMAELVAELDASAFIIEPLPNMTIGQVTDRLPMWVDLLRARHPQTPILLVENPLYGRDAAQNKALQKVFSDAKKRGVKRLWLLPSTGQLATRENGTVDGVHPTDLGFLQMAETYEPVLRQILKSR